MDQPLNVLFLCTGNSARSILGEVLLNNIGAGKFKAYSAGSFPKGEVNPYALELLKNSRFSVEGLRSKSWDEFATSDAPPMHFVFTVCDSAANEVCPVWPGQPISAHWGLEDPAAVEGSDEDKRRAFLATMTQLQRRIEILVNLPLASLDRLSLQAKLREIGNMTDKATV
jgi:arsenate reductase (thioredoxin)